MNDSFGMPPQNGEQIDEGEQDFGAETWLQRVVAESPGILEGDETNLAVLRPWLLIAREMPVLSEGEGDDKLDHLFLDQNAVPILVEVKRRSNRDLRRRVIGQILDYAANGIARWSGEKICAQFEKTWATPDGKREFNKVFGMTVNQEDVWRQAETNLRTKKIRLAVVADTIPMRLYRIVEFLNAEMITAEIVACDIIEYEVAGKKTRVPRVVNRVTVVERERSSPADVEDLWDESSFFAAFANHPEWGQAARRILKWAEDHNLRIEWGNRGDQPAYLLVIEHKGQEIKRIAVRSAQEPKKPYVELRLKNIEKVPPFHDPRRYSEFEQRWNRIPGVRDFTAREFRNIDLSSLTNDAALEKFFAAVEWLVQEIKTV